MTGYDIKMKENDKERLQTHLRYNILLNRKLPQSDGLYSSVYI